jgi:hypothetical protein
MRLDPGLLTHANWSRPCRGGPDVSRVLQHALITGQLRLGRGGEFPGDERRNRVREEHVFVR